MTPEPSLCPFCNAVLPALTAPAGAGKLPCPRCGELVPAARWRIDAAVRAGEPPTRPAPTTNPAAHDPRPGVRKTLYIVLGIMFVMAVTSLSYALWSRPERRARDPWMPTKLTPVAFRQPIELPGLGYLPKGSQLVAAIQVAELVDDKAVGQPLLAEPRPSTFAWVLKQIAKTTGLQIEQLDHVVLATSFDALPPQLTMVVQTRQPYSLKTVTAAVPHAKTSLYRDQPVYEFSLNPVGEALLWCVSERTMIFVVRLDPPTHAHLQGLSTTPRPPDDVLTAPVRAAMTERLPRHNLLWAVGQLDQLGALKDWLPWVGKADFGALKDMKTFALGIAPVEGMTLTGHFQLNDAKAAAKFQTMLDDVKIAGAKSHKVVGPGPEAVDPAAQWVTWQVRGDAAAMRAFLDRGKK